MIDTLTLGEIEEIEQYADASITLIGDDVPQATKLRVGLAWIILRRSNPAATVGDAKKMTMEEMSKLFDGLDEKKAS